MKIKRRNECNNLLCRSDDYVVTRITTITVCCVAHCIVQNSTEHCVNVFTGRKRLSLLVIKPQRTQSLCDSLCLALCPLWLNKTDCKKK
jgi:hypothetical protein